MSTDQKVEALARFVSRVRALEGACREAAKHGRVDSAGEAFTLIADSLQFALWGETPPMLRSDYDYLYKDADE